MLDLADIAPYLIDKGWSARGRSSYAWFGRRSRPLPRAVASALASDSAREILMDGLPNVLYRSFYTHGRPVPVSANCRSKDTKVHSSFKLAGLDEEAMTALVQVALVEAGLGRADACRRHAAEAIELSLRRRLCFGERLCRARWRQKGREFLVGALETFEALGSEPWAARAREALAEIDGTVHRRDGWHSRLHRARVSFDRPHTGAAQTA